MGDEVRQSRQTSRGWGEKRMRHVLRLKTEDRTQHLIMPETVVVIPEKEKKKIKAVVYEHNRLLQFCFRRNKTKKEINSFELERVSKFVCELPGCADDNQ